MLAFITLTEKAVEKLITEGGPFGFAALVVIIFTGVILTCFNKLVKVTNESTAVLTGLRDHLKRTSETIREDTGKLAEAINDNTTKLDLVCEKLGTCIHILDPEKY